MIFNYEDFWDILHLRWGRRHRGGTEKLYTEHSSTQQLIVRDVTMLRLLTCNCHLQHHNKPSQRGLNSVAQCPCITWQCTDNPSPKVEFGGCDTHVHGFKKRSSRSRRGLGRWQVKSPLKSPSQLSPLTFGSKFINFPIIHQEKLWEAPRGILH